jgi:hypothetical protein
MPKLVFIDEGFAGRVYELTLEKTTVGRAEQNDLVLHDASVSSHHCEITVYGPEVIAHDLNSRNGTFVDGVKVEKQAQIKGGQLVRFGTVAARLELDPPTASDDATAMTAVFALRHIARQEQQERSKPGPANPHQELGRVASPDASEGTLMLPRSAPRTPAPAPGGAEKPPESPAGSHAGKWIAIGLLLALGLAFLIWWLMKK